MLLKPVAVLPTTQQADEDIRLLRRLYSRGHCCWVWGRDPDAVALARQTPDGCRWRVFLSWRDRYAAYVTLPGTHHPVTPPPETVSWYYLGARYTTMRVLAELPETAYIGQAVALPLQCRPPVERHILYRPAR